jgi:hypothetical protein
MSGVRKRHFCRGQTVWLRVVPEGCPSAARGCHVHDWLLLPKGLRYRQRPNLCFLVVPTGGQQRARRGDVPCWVLLCSEKRQQQRPVLGVHVVGQRSQEAGVTPNSCSDLAAALPVAFPPGFSKSTSLWLSRTSRVRLPEDTSVPERSSQTGRTSTTVMKVMTTIDVVKQKIQALFCLS